MKALLILCALGVVAAAPKGRALTSAYTFAEYAAEFRPELTPSSPEWTKREAIFKKHLVEALEHNANTKNTWTKGVNRFFDWTPTEFKSMRKYQPIHNLVEDRSYEVITNYTVPAGWVAPTSVDWRTKNVLSPVKDQGACGGCWAFAATEAIEASVAINNGTAPVALAVEQILDCTPNPQMCGGTGGCNGATAELAYGYAKSSGGITADSNLPYAGGGTCPSSLPAAAARVASFTVISTNDRAAVIHALATMGPITIGVDASSWQFYSGGVTNACNQEATLTLDHAVQLVAFATNADGSITWTVRNSWGAGWGESGFIELSDQPLCVQDNDPASGSGCPNGPSTIKVCGPCGLLYEVSWPTAYAV